MILQKFLKIHAIKNFHTNLRNFHASYTQIAHNFGRELTLCLTTVCIVGELSELLANFRIIEQQNSHKWHNVQ